MVASDYGWLRVVMGWLRVVKSGYGWLWVVTSGYGWFLGCTCLLEVMASASGWLWGSNGWFYL